jgi:hypothetical protein
VARPVSLGERSDSASVGPSPADYRLWLSGGRLGVGLGWVMRAPRFDDVPGAARAASPVMGLRWRVAPGSAVYLDSEPHPLEQRRVASLPAEGTRLGVEFKSASDNVAHLLRGSLLRVQMSSAAQLSLKLRGGRLGVVWQAEF